MNTLLSLLIAADARLAGLETLLKTIAAQGGDLGAEAQKILDLIGAGIDPATLPALGAILWTEAQNVIGGKFSGADHAGDSAP